MIKAELKDNVIAIKEQGKAILTISVERNPDVIQLVSLLDQANVLDLDVEETTFKGKLHQRREKLGMTHEQLGDLVGCSRQTIVKIENGSSMPKLNLALKIADALNMDVRDILN